MCELMEQQEIYCCRLATELVDEVLRRAISTAFPHCVKKRYDALEKSV